MYKKDFEEFVEFCNLKKAEIKNEKSLLAYCAYLNENKYSPNTINTKVSHVKLYKKRENDYLYKMEEIYNYINSLKDNYVNKKAHPFSEGFFNLFINFYLFINLLILDDLNQFFEEFSNNGKDLVMKIFVLFGIYGALRKTQLDRIDFKNVETKPDGLWVTTSVLKRKQKKTQERKPLKRIFHIPSSSNPNRCIINLFNIYKNKLEEDGILLKGKIWKQPLPNNHFKNQNIGKNILAEYSKNIAKKLNKEN